MVRITLGMGDSDLIYDIVNKSLAIPGHGDSDRNQFMCQGRDARIPYHQGNREAAFKLKEFPFLLTQVLSATCGDWMAGVRDISMVYIDS